MEQLERLLDGKASSSGGRGRLLQAASFSRSVGKRGASASQRLARSSSASTGPAVLLLFCTSTACAPAHSRSKAVSHAPRARPQTSTRGTPRLARGSKCKVVVVACASPVRPGRFSTPSRAPLDRFAARAPRRTRPSVAQRHPPRSPRSARRTGRARKRTGRQEAVEDDSEGQAGELTGGEEPASFKGDPSSPTSLHERFSPLYSPVRLVPVSELIRLLSLLSGPPLFARECASVPLRQLASRQPIEWPFADQARPSRHLPLPRRPSPPAHPTPGSIEHRNDIVPPSLSSRYPRQLSISMSTGGFPSRPQLISMPSLASSASSDLALDDQPEAASTSSSGWPSPSPATTDRFPPAGSRDGLRLWSAVEEAKESLRDASGPEAERALSAGSARGEHGDPAPKRWRASAGLENGVESIDLARELDGNDDMAEQAQGQ